MELRSSGKWILLASLVGVIAGLAAIAFQTLGHLVTRYSLVEFAGFVPEIADGEHSLADQPATTLIPWMIVVVMTIGGLISGLLVYWLAPETEGAGTDAAIDAFHNRRGIIRTRVAFVKTLASSITLGTGGSGGQEGPIAQIGASIGSWLGTRLKLSPRDRRIMLAAGMGAGVGAIFRAPLAGAVFAAEILYSDADLEADVIVPAATSSIVAYSVFTQFLPADRRFQPLFGTELNHLFASPVELLPYTVLAVVLMLVGILYVKVFQQSQTLFRNLPLVPHLRPAIGAALAGLIGIGLLALHNHDPRVLAVLGIGYGTLQIALTDAPQLGIGLLLTIAFAKIATTALTIGSGGSGGVFGPSMVIGGCLGAVVGLAFQSVFPWSVSEPEAFAVVGMAGFFAGVARAPISTIIMVRAMTGDFGLLVPTMLVTTLTFLTSHKWRLYQKQVPTRMDSKAHRGDFIIDVLEGLHVEDVFRRDQNIVKIPQAMTLDEIVHCLADNHQHYFPVVDQQQRMVGIFSDDDVRVYLFDDVLWDLVVAEDIMKSDFVSVSPHDDLNTAMKRFTALNLDELPVIDPEQPGKLLGMLRRKESIAAYNRRLMEHKQAAEE
tara:strand:- start:562667 stop:564481 length:1815 start_codon:yes stop_codon:yes gene_type:complete